jgi:hypothetical protein
MGKTCESRYVVNGKIINGKILCEKLWTGPDCNEKVCLNNCNNKLGLK